MKSQGFSFDPDIIIGYDNTRFSWGYLVERAISIRRAFLRNISRVVGREVLEEALDLEPISDCKSLQGRISLECWRIVRRESQLKCLDFSNAVFSILGKKVPCFSSETMRTMLESDEPGVRLVPGLIAYLQQPNAILRATLFRHFLCRSSLNLELLRRIDIFVRTSQMAKGTDSMS